MLVWLKYFWLPSKFFGFFDWQGTSLHFEYYFRWNIWANSVLQCQKVITSAIDLISLFLEMPFYQVRRYKEMFILYIYTGLAYWASSDIVILSALFTSYFYSTIGYKFVLCPLKKKNPEQTVKLLMLIVTVLLYWCSLAKLVSIYKILVCIYMVWKIHKYFSRVVF